MNTETDCTERIRNDTEETDPNRKKINKKLSEMSKEAKKRKPLRAPPKDDDVDDDVYEEKSPKVKQSSDINYGFVIAVIGIILAVVNLYYTRISTLKTPPSDDEEVKEEKSKEEKEKKSNEVKAEEVEVVDPHRERKTFTRYESVSSGIYSFDD